MNGKGRTLTPNRTSLCMDLPPIVLGNDEEEVRLQKVETVILFYNDRSDRLRYLLRLSGEMDRFCCAQFCFLFLSFLSFLSSLSFPSFLSFLPLFLLARHPPSEATTPRSPISCCVAERRTTIQRLRQRRPRYVFSFDLLSLSYAIIYNEMSISRIKKPLP